MGGSVGGCVGEGVSSWHQLPGATLRVCYIIQDTILLQGCVNRSSLVKAAG